MATDGFDKEELRIALVMNGGVSLAVWIGGVVREVARLLAGASAYGELAELLAIDARVDVIAGTSAGGVNGAYLAQAMAYHDAGDSLEQALGGLRNLWVDDGAIDRLLRNPFEKAPPSLLDGDGFYLKALRDAFNGLKRPETTSPDKVPVDLILTATLLKGTPKQFVDDYGSPVIDVSHRARFCFRRHRGKDQFTENDSAARLALAARTTSSFPGAFEPSFCPIGPDTERSGRPDMGAVASFKQSRFLIDGGILDNKPLGAALESIFGQRANRPTRRVLAYIVPAPDSTAGGQGYSEERKDDPGLLKVVLSSLVEIPSVQSISAQLEELRRHNEAVRDKRRSRIVITRYNSPKQIDALAATLFEAYRDIRVTLALDYVIGQINQGLMDKAGAAPFGRRGRREWLHRKLYELKDELPWIPTIAPLARSAASERRGEDWRWGARPVEHFAQLLLDLVVRTQRIAAARVEPCDLSRFWDAAFNAIAASGGLRSKDQDYWQQQAEAVTRSLGTGLDSRSPRAGAQSWFKAAVLDWRASKVVEASTLAARIAGDVAEMAPVAIELARAACGSPDPSLARDANDLLKLFGYFVRDAGDAADKVLARLLAFEVVQEALGAQGAELEEEVDFIQISGDDDTPDGSGKKAADKLNGVQLAHFGAFYKRSWRANDWLWGRRDAVRRLVRLLLDPSRLRAIAQRQDPPLGAAAMAKKLMKIAQGFSNRADTSWKAVLKLDAAKAEKELAYLDDDSLPVPERLPRITEAIARRLELEILCEELPSLASAIEEDSKAGLATSIAVAGFASECLAAQKSENWLTAASANGLQPRCSLGAERLQAEVGTDRATGTIAQALAVSVAAVGGDKRISASLGGAIAFLRTPTLLFHVFARNLAQRERTGLVINAALAAASAAIVVTTMIAAENPYGSSTLVAVAGGVLVASGFLLLSRIRRHWLRWLIACLLLAGVLAGLAFGLADVGVRAWRNIALIEGGLIASLLLGRLLIRRGAGES